MRGAAENLSDLADQQREWLLQEQRDAIRREIEKQRQEEQRKWAEKVAEETYQRYKTDPVFRKKCDETKRQVDEKLAAEEKKSPLEKLLDEIERKKKVEEEEVPRLRNADGPYYDEHWAYPSDDETH
jgi:hypothetical protein